MWNIYILSPSPVPNQMGVLDTRLDNYISTVPRQRTEVGTILVFEPLLLGVSAPQFIAPLSQRRIHSFWRDWTRMVVLLGPAQDVLKHLYESELRNNAWQG